MTQMSLFGEDERVEAPQAPDPERERLDRIRQRLGAVLDELRSAARMPWSEADERMWREVFPVMAGWLPAGETEQLCFDFDREMERLRDAA